MSKGFLVFDIPNCCAECYLRARPEEWPVEPGLYKKISRCMLATDDMEDPWRDIRWQLNHKESWCPIKDIPAKFDADAPWAGRYEEGYNDCIDEILKEKTK